MCCLIELYGCLSIENLHVTEMMKTAVSLKSTKSIASMALVDLEGSLKTQPRRKICGHYCGSFQRKFFQSEAYALKQKFYFKSE